PSRGDLMLILRAGLYVSALAAVYTTWASNGAGYAIEVAMLRGLLAFMAVTVVAYLAELVVLTAPPPRKSQGMAAGQAAGEDETDPGQPTNLPAVRAERDIAADERRAA